MNKQEVQINLAEQQLLGFSHAKRGYSLTDLIIAMGLTIKEWKSLKKDYSLSYLNEDDYEEIENYFKKKQK